MIEYRRVTSLKGKFVPTSAGENLPAIYAHVQKIGGNPGAAVRKMRYEDYPQVVYNAAYNTLSHVLDAKMQQEELSKLRQNLKTLPREEHPERISEYWEIVSSHSAINDYKQAAVELRGYGESMANRTGEDFTPRVPTRKEDSPYLSQVLEYHPTGFHPVISNEALSKNPPRSQAFIDTYNQLEGNDALIGYVTALHIRTALRTLTIDKVVKHIDSIMEASRGRFALTIPSVKDKFSQLLKVTEPNQTISVRVAAKISEKQEEMFGNEPEAVDVVAGLWKAAIFVRAGELKGKISARSIRSNLIALLQDGNYKEGKAYVEEIMARIPSAYPDFVVDQLSIEPAELRALYLEESKSHVSQTQKSAEQRRKAATFIETYLGKTLRSLDGSMEISINKAQSVNAYHFVGGIPQIVVDMGRHPKGNTFSAVQMSDLIYLLDLEIAT